MAETTDGPDEARLADVEAIRQLKARYFRFLDTQDWPAFRGLFVEDAELDVSDDGAGVVRGSEAIASSIAGALEGASTVHQGTTPEITVDGDEATGRPPSGTARGSARPRPGGSRR
ncbi:MAG: nuclear transport factor 2 family protein, partial [Actinomycetota bacterium]